MEENLKNISQSETTPEKPLSDTEIKLKQLEDKLQSLEKTNQELITRNAQYIDKMFSFTNNESTIQDKFMSDEEKIAELRKNKGSYL